MTGRRVSRHGGALRKPAAQRDRAAAQTAARVNAATSELDELGIAYGRLRAAAAKARKAGKSDAVLRKIRALTAELNSAAAALETTRRR